MAGLNKILHVDDDDDIRTITRMSLEVVGDFSVHQCSSGPQAIAEAEAFGPDLLLLDVMMPGMDGIETWAKLKATEQMANTPAIFMTAKAEDATSKELLEAGAIAVITKPFDPVQLAQQIQSAWDANVSS